MKQECFSQNVAQPKWFLDSGYQGQAFWSIKNNFVHIRNSSFIIATLTALSLLAGCHPKNASTIPDAKLYSYPAWIVLENDVLKAIFSKETGALLCFENKQTQWKIQNRPALGISFNLMAPMPEKRNNSVSGQKQRLKKFELSTDHKTIIFFWEKLNSEFAGVLDINLKGTVALTDLGLKFNMEVENKSAYVVDAVSYPALGDIPQPSKEETLDLLRWGYAGFDKSSLLPYFSNFKGYFGVDYPMQTYNNPDVPFILATTGKQGFYAGLHDTTNNEMVSFTFELKPGYGISHGEYHGAMITDTTACKETPRLEMNTWHFTYVNPGENNKTSDIVISPYNGTWHKGADIYKNWRKTWYKEPPCPQWAKEVHSWQQIQINCSEDNLLFRYKELVDYARQCAKHGVKAIQLTVWNNGGQDRGNPSHDTDPRLGSWQDLKDAIADCEKLGVHIILFNKYTWADQSSEWFRKELVRFAVKNMYGDYHVYGGYQYHTPEQLNDISTRRLIPMCMLSKQWRDIANTEFRKSIDLGASGMLYDECQHHGGAKYCFDKTHGHHVPAFVYQGDGDLDRVFRSTADKLNPNYLFAGEACYDLEYRYYNIIYFRISHNDQIPGQRYIDNNKGMMFAVTGFDDRMMPNAALRFKYIMSYEPYFFKGKLDDFPKTIAYGEKIDNLRKLYKEFLWDGEFRDLLDAKVTRDGKEFNDYSVFKHVKENKRAVVIVNNDIEKEVEISVKIENSDLPMVYVTLENATPVACNGKVKIPAQSTVVIMEK